MGPLGDRMKFTEYEIWERMVHAKLIQLCGMSGDNLPDWGSYAAWKAGMSVADAAEEWLEHAKTF